MSVLEKSRWWDPSRFEPHLAYLRSLNASQIVDWVLLVPSQTATGALQASVSGSVPLSLARRRRSRPPLFGAVSESFHRQTPKRIAGLAVPGLDPAAEALRGPARGALVLYPVVEADSAAAARELVRADGSIRPEDLVMGFVMVPPPSAEGTGPARVRFRARNADKAGQAVVDVEEQAVDGE